MGGTATLRNVATSITFMLMRTVTIAELRRNLSGIVDTVARYRHKVARLVPPVTSGSVSPAQFAAIMANTPVDDAWGAELMQMRREDEASDPW